MNNEQLLIERQISSWLSRKTPYNGIRRIVTLSAAIMSEQGNFRSENQDRALIVRSNDARGNTIVIAAIADGIGGMKHGSQCASIAIGAFASHLLTSFRAGIAPLNRMVSEAATAADYAVFSKFNGDGGSTLVAVVITSNNPPLWLSIGDSRAYKVNELSVEQLSTDDTIAGQLGKTAENSPEHEKLLQFIGMGHDLLPHVDTITKDDKSKMLLTTDGIHYIAKSSSFFSSIILNSPDIGSCVKRLADVAKWCGGQDNSTAIMIETTHAPERVEWNGDSLIEAWDSYGDFQIVLYEKKTQIHDQNSKREDKVCNPHGDRLAANSIHKQDKTRRKKQKPNKKRVELSETKESIENKNEISSPSKPEPQLDILFPNKTNE